MNASKINSAAAILVPAVLGLAHLFAPALVASNPWLVPVLTIGTAIWNNLSTPVHQA